MTEIIQDIPLFIIVGSPRSGTNMLHGFLDANPETVIPTEFPFIPLYAALFSHKKRMTEMDVDTFLYWLQKDIRYPFWSVRRWNIDLALLRKKLNERVPAGLTYAAVCKTTIALFQSVFLKTEPRVLILKEPAYSSEIPLLIDIFPEVKFIFLHRDPRAQVNSMRKMPFGSRLLTANAYHWNRTQAQLIRQSNLDAERFYTVSYEELVFNTEPVLQGICSFLKIEYSSKMMQYSEKRSSIETQYGLNDPDILRLGKSSLVSPDPAMVNAWKTDLSSNEIRCIEAGCHKTMTALGYSTIQKHGLLDRIRFIPVKIHFFLQRCIGCAMRVLPFRCRLRILFMPSLFEATYGRVFGRRRRSITQ